MSAPTPNTPTVTDATEDLPRDPKTGRFQKGHLVNQKHGAITLERRGPSPEQAAAMQQWRSQVITELGCEAELSTIKRHLIDHLVMIGTMIIFLGEYLAAVGPLTPRGRQRSAVSSFLSCVAAYDKTAKTLGLERKAKRLQSALDVINLPEEDNDAA
jgi:hypothetical protein